MKDNYRCCEQKNKEFSRPKIRRVISKGRIYELLGEKKEFSHRGHRGDSNRMDRIVRIKQIIQLGFNFLSCFILPILFELTSVSSVAHFSYPILRINKRSRKIC